MRRFAIFLLLLTILTACVPAQNQALPRAPSPGLLYTGVNIEVLAWQSGNVGAIRLWEMFTPGRYNLAKMTGILSHIQPKFNTVRFVVGSKHFVQIPGYKENVLDSLQMAKQNNVYVVIGIWTTEITTGLNVDYTEYDPYFDPAGFELQKQAMRELAQLITDHDLNDTVLYIDLRNEINGHIGSAYDDEWYAAENKYDSAWGYVPNRAVTSWRAWLSDKYSSVSSLNSAWGTSYASFDNIPVFHDISEISGNVTVIANDDQEWLVWCLRDWVVQLRDVIKAVNPTIKVGQSTTNDTFQSSYPDYEVMTRAIFNQLAIGDLVDVIDFHMYRDSYQPVLDRIRQRWPDKLFVAGEFRNSEGAKIEAVAEMGNAGMLYWATACERGADVSQCTHYWDNFELTSTGRNLADLFASFVVGDFIPTIAPTQPTGAPTNMPSMVPLTIALPPIATPRYSPAYHEEPNEGNFCSMVVTVA